MTLVRLEEAYHLEHAREWFGRLADGPVTAREHLAAGLEAALPDALGLFEPLPGEEALLADGVLPRPGEALLAEWLARVGEELERVSLDYVLERHTPVGDLVPTSSGEIEGDEVLGGPGRSSAATAGGCTRAGSPARAGGAAATRRTSPACGRI